MPSHTTAPQPRRQEEEERFGFEQTPKAARRREPGEMGTKPAGADKTIKAIPAAAYPSAASSSPTPAQPGTGTFYSTLQVVQGIFYGAPVVPVLEDGYPAGAEEALRRVVEGDVHGVVVGTKDSYLRACGRIPMICPGGQLDLNAPAPGDAADQPPPERRPVICAYCNCAFCFGEYERQGLSPPPGFAYPARPVPPTADLFITAPPVGPLRGDAAVPVPLPVCSNPHHFMVAMGMLRLPHDAPSLVWKRPSSLGVLPTVVVGGAARGSLQTTLGISSSGLHCSIAPPPAPTSTSSVGAPHDP